MTAQGLFRVVVRTVGLIWVVLSFTTIVSFSIRYPFMEDSSRTISDLLSPVANLLFGLVLLFSANWIVRAMKWD